MMRACFLAPALACLVFGATGCTAARMVSWAGDGGVIAIPNNTDVWPDYERTAANKLMAEKCPNGYEIVEEGEVVVGKKTTTSDTVDRKPTGSGDKLATRTTENSVTKSADQTEYRIRFRPLNAGRPTTTQTVQTKTPANLPPVIQTTGATTPMTPPKQPVPAGMPW